MTLIDKGDAFVFGFSKLDLMFGHAQPDAVRVPYGEIAKPGVRVPRETVTAIDLSRGHAVIGVCGAPFKCPPAPSECALPLDDQLRARGVGGRIGSVDIDFLPGPSRTGSFNAPSAAKLAEKEHFGASRRARWFGS